MIACRHEFLYPYTDSLTMKLAECTMQEQLVFQVRLSSGT